MKVAIPLAKNVLAPLGIATAASAIDAEIQKKIHGSGTTTLMISHEEINGIMKIVQVPEDFNVLLKGVTKRIKNETKEQKGRFLSMLLGTLGASLLGYLLAGKGIVGAGSGNKKGKGIVRAGSGKKMRFLMPPHPLSQNFEIQKYYQNETRFNGVFSRNNLPKK